MNEPSDYIIVLSMIFLGIPALGLLTTLIEIFM